TEKYLITKIEGKDSNFILSDSGQRFYPSFFNQFVNELNQKVEESILEIKVYERGQKELEIQYILIDSKFQDQVKLLTLAALEEKMSRTMDFQVRFVDFIDHDYRRKYRVIERLGDVEFAGGMVGDERKSNAVQQIMAEAEAAD
ncbi:MAG: hypothetical protein AAF939_22145, partial [Planctomycetota bacterium]